MLSQVLVTHLPVSRSRIGADHITGRSDRQICGSVAWADVRAHLGIDETFRNLVELVGQLHKYFLHFVQVFIRDLLHAPRVRILRIDLITHLLNFLLPIKGQAGHGRADYQQWNRYKEEYTDAVARYSIIVDLSMPRQAKATCGDSAADE